MTSVTTSDYTNPQQLGDNHNVKLNSNTQIIIEHNSDDITISKCEQNPVSQEVSSNSNQNTLPLKAQVLPLVYIPNNNKIPFAAVNSGNKGNSNFILSSVTTNANSNQNVIFASGRSRPLVLPKPPIAFMPGVTKVANTYVTMLKQIPKPTECQISQSEITNSVKAENIIMTQSGFVQSSATPQKFVLTPMPKIQTNRPPATVTTNSVQPKFTVLPMPFTQNETAAASTNQKVYNFQISDGKLQYSSFSSPVTIMCETKQINEHNRDIIDVMPEQNDLVCSEKIQISPEKNDISNKTYELSIAEESLSNQSDGRLVVSSVDSNSSSENVSSNNFSKHPLKFSHGVSILKKNFIASIFQDSKKNESVPVTNSLKSNAESDLTIIKPSNGLEEKIVVTIPNISTVKPERERSRRKSQFSFRKDFDDMDISFPDSETEIKKEGIKLEITQDEKIEKKDKKNEKMETEQETESVTHLKNIFNLCNNEFNAAKLLNWEDDVGTLPGSNLKFIVNEFGIIEYLSEEDYQKILEKRLKKTREKEDLEREVQCIECGCYGLRSDFISSNFCSVDCQDSCLTLGKRSDFPVLKKNKHKFGKSKSDNDIKDNDFSGEDENSNDATQDKFTYPWACKKKGFLWSKYLTHVNAKAAPIKLFKDPFPYTRNSFKLGMKLEGVDPQHPSYFCVLTVVDTIGYRIRLHFDGFSDNYDFWVNADSMDIFPMGWCEKYGHVLHPPPGYTEENFNWVQYLRITKSTAAPKHLFANRAGQAICPNGFRIGMKLEAVDKKNSSLVCVATVRDMMDNRLLVHFDGWDDIYDYWADPTSPYIHPVGWCDQYGHNLTPPSDYPTPESFTWEKYLKERKAVAAPVRAFKQRSACGFKRGMRLECVDKRVPHLIRVATVDDVKEHQIRIHFDGWPDRYSYWVDDDSPDIHPVGWCQKTGHPLEPPLTPDDVYDFLECQTVGCRGQGHTLGLKYTTHSTQKYCPYAESNIDIERIHPDRLLSPDRSPEAKIPVSREPKDYKLKPRVGRPPKWLKELEATKVELILEPPEKKPKRKHVKIKKEKEDPRDTGISCVEEKVKKLIGDFNILPAEKESWKKHSAFLNEYISSDENPLSWSTCDVVEFVTSVLGYDSNSDVFKDHCIDGESFLQLNQADILYILKYKVGPAIKVYNSIVLLREQYYEQTK